MASGKVKWYNNAKGFGFIASDDGGKDVFLHASEVKRAGIAPAEGDLLQFSVEDGAKGPKAVDVRPAEPVAA